MDDWRSAPAETQAALAMQLMFSLLRRLEREGPEMAKLVEDVIWYEAMDAFGERGEDDMVSLLEGLANRITPDPGKREP